MGGGLRGDEWGECEHRAQPRPERPANASALETRIQTWALEEARRRLEAEGILPDPEVGQK